MNAFILHFLSIFLRLFPCERAQQTDGGLNRPPNIRAWPASQNGLALDHVYAPPQLLVANNGRRYVFSQPILDHVCIGNASHLERSRPGGRIRSSRLTSSGHDNLAQRTIVTTEPQQYTTFETVHFSIAQETLCVSNFSQPSRFANIVALSACCHQLCLAPFAPYSASETLVVFSLFLSTLDFQPFPPVAAVPSPCTTLIQ